MLHTIIVNSDHFQLLVADTKYGPTIDTTHSWDSAIEGVASLPEAPQLIAIPTVRYGGNVTVEVEVLKRRPSANYARGWHKIGMFAIEVESGELILWGPERIDLGSAPRIKLDAGQYHGIAYSCDTAQVDDEQALDGPDRYRLCMWLVHKQDIDGSK